MNTASETLLLKSQAEAIVESFGFRKYAKLVSDTHSINYIKEISGGGSLIINLEFRPTGSLLIGATLISLYKNNNYNGYQYLCYYGRASNPGYFINTSNGTLYVGDSIDYNETVEVDCLISFMYFIKD